MKIHNNEKASEHLKYHLDNDILIHENIFRYGSDEWLNIINESRKLYNEGEVIELDSDEYAAINSDVGLKSVYEGKEVCLELPMICEDDHDFMEIYYNDDHNETKYLRMPRTI